MVRSRKIKKDETLDFNKILQQVSDELDVFNADDIKSFGNLNTVDIITFRNSIAKIDNSKWPYMDIVLKMFYSKTIGNENLELTDEDIYLIKNINNYKHRIEEDAEKELNDLEEHLGEAERESLNIIQKMVKEWGGCYWLGEQVKNLRNSEKNPFTTLVLALGRRSGKSFIAALIAAYEAYKLLTIVTCRKCKIHYADKRSGSKCSHCGETLMNHPQSYYELTEIDNINIIMSSTSTKQADDNMLDKFYGLIVTKSPFFEGRYKKNDQVKEIYFKTEYDFIFDEKQQSLGQPAHNGSVVVMLAGANAKAQHGRGAVLTIVDEFDLFNNEGIDTDKAVMEALIPASAQYRLKGDGRVIMISMPGEKTKTEFQKYAKMGMDILHKGFKRTLVFQMPTWEYNRSFSEEFIIDNFGEEFGGDSASAKFHRVFGAQFTEGNVDVFIPEKFIRESVQYGLYLKQSPTNRSHRHYMHIDCAGTGNCNYACLVGHWEYDTSRKEKIFYEDYSFYWSYTDLIPGMFIGSDGNEYNIEQLLEEIIRIAKLFRISRLSYDNMQSEESIFRFKRHGIQTEKISFSKSIQSHIYQLLEELFLSKKIKLCCDDNLLIAELKNLRRAPMKPNTRGLEVVIPENSEIQTKDLADCLGGAIFGSYKLPFGKNRQIPARAVDTSIPRLSSSGGNSINNRAGSIFNNNPRIFQY